ncbi:MAG: low molecular weight protein-tyrosine-phosphatase [Coriobacteriia bacterium]|nr:low molecular weight protein-tyrosine-phosphatase [Coriobacteriia bacterium]
MGEATMVRILFVCHGNICRSTMAQFVMEHLVEHEGVADCFVIDSAATSREEIGNDVHPGTQRVLAQQGIACGSHRARQIRVAEADDWDLIVGMDQRNMSNLRRMLPASIHGKLYKLMEFADSDQDVADPWYTGDFQTTFDDVWAGCSGLLARLQRQGMA